MSGPVRTGGIEGIDWGTAVMELFVLVFFVVLAVAGLAGRVVDTRDSADWRPSNGGFRDSPHRG